LLPSANYCPPGFRFYTTCCDIVHQLRRENQGGRPASTYCALRDTRTPLRYAVVRVALTTGLGYLCSIPLPIWIGIDPRWGAAGLTASAAVAAGAAWVVKLGMGHRDHPIKTAVAILGTYGVVYFGASYAMRVEECAGALRRVARLRRPGVGTGADAAR
jgi:hypothetical protein